MITIQVTNKVTAIIDDTNKVYRLIGSSSTDWGKKIVSAWQAMMRSKGYSLIK